MSSAAALPSNLRVGLVAEGPTDQVIIEAILDSVFPGVDVVVTSLQPEVAAVFTSNGGGFGQLGSGWTGVYRWCQQAAEHFAAGLRGKGSPLPNHDILIIHVDADVARMDYASGDIKQLTTELPLPCAQQCPPAASTVSELRKVILSWCGDPVFGPQVVTCTPCQSTEAWVVAALFPNDSEVVKDSDWECFAKPEVRLGQQRAKNRIRKSKRHYNQHREAITAAWPRVTADLSQAMQFDIDLRTASGP